MKKVLIITYYWPSGGGGGVMRWLKMSQYLFSDSDWEPIIFTPKNAGYLVNDSSLNDQLPKNLKVLRHPILEPNNFLSKLGLNKFKKNVAAGGIGGKNKSASFLEKTMVWIRSNLFIPDARFLWIKPASRKIIQEIKNLDIDAIITTGPPHSMHLIGLNIKKKTGIPWIADFRDPWTFIDFFEDLNLSQLARKKHFRLEKSVVELADKLVTVSQSWADDFEKLYGKKFELITNGFDPADFKNQENVQLDEKFTITHIGSLNKDRNSPVIWQALAEICKENQEFKDKLEVQLIGNITSELEEELIELQLKDSVKIVNHISHNKVIDIIQTSNLLLLLINNTSNKSGIIPGKLYEYLAAKRPIISIGDKSGDSAKIIEETNAGKMIGFDEKNLLKNTIIDHFNSSKTIDFKNFSSNKIEKYSRKNLAMQYANLLDSIVIK